MGWLSGLTERFGKKSGVVGIELLADSLAVAVRGTGAHELEEVELLLRPATGSDSSFEKPMSHSSGLTASDMSELLTPFIEKHNLSNSSCEIILSPSDYQLLLVEAPEVPDTELKDAVRWRIKDLISMPIAEAVIDIFRLPEDANRAGKKMVYVVVTKFTKVKELVDLISNVGLKLQSIDIGEFALRNLVIQDNDSRGVAVARICGGQGVLSIYRQGNLYLSRQFKLDYDGGLLTELPEESFALEIQRSLDYFERQMGQAPPSLMYICGESISEDKITDGLTQGLTIPIHFLDIKKLLKASSDLDDGIAQLCVGAIGATYRNEAA